MTEREKSLSRSHSPKKFGAFKLAWVESVRATKDGTKPWPRELFDQLLRRAEQEAELEHLKGGLWHPFRRKWATERKHHSIVDVKAAGGWKDTNTLLTCYQHTSDESMLAVMESPRKLVSSR